MKTNMAMSEDVAKKVRAYFEGKTSAHYAKGEIITHAGESPRGVSLLLSGVVEQYDSTPEGNYVTVNLFKPLAFFPMSWAINKTPNTYFYVALTDVTLQWADPDETALFLQDNPDVLFDLLRRVYIGTDMLLRRLVLAASGAAASRLIFELLIEAYRFGTNQANGSCVVVIKQHTLAARSGLARETVSRELHKLQKDGVIELAQKGIIIYVEQLEATLRTA